jgi:hypothetical protein
MAPRTPISVTGHFCRGAPRWIGGADAYHKYHPTEPVPIRHLRDIVRNATTLHRHCGFWPMQGWLTAFQQLGLADCDAELERWLVTAS